MKYTIITLLSFTLLSQAAQAIPCMPEFDNDYHYSDDVFMCRNQTKYLIAGLTDDLKQPVRDKVIIKHIQPANATAYVSITPYSPLIIDGQISTFTIPAQEGQCIDLISTYPHGLNPLGFQLTLVDGTNSATTADFDYEVGSSC